MRSDVTRPACVKPIKEMDNNIKSALQALQNVQAVLEIQTLQNRLRDLRDSDLQDNDDYWYTVIDGVSELTGVSPQ